MGKRPITKADMAKDYMMGLKNPCYIIEKYLRAYDKTQGGYVPFKLFPKQKEIIFGYENHRHNLVTKPRQTGVSTTTAAYLAVKAVFADPNFPEEIIIIANKFASAKRLLNTIRGFLADIPAFLWGDKYDYNKSVDGHIVGKGSSETLKLCNGSLIKAIATSPDALRSWSPTYLVIDEAAYIETYAAELYTASMASLSTGGDMIIISTPNGKDELYYKTYANAKAGENEFNVTELKWYHDPRYNKELEWHLEDENGNLKIVKEKDFTFESFDKMEKAGYKAVSPWYLQMCKNLNHNKLAIAKDLEVKFSGSAGTVIEQAFIDYQMTNNVTKDYVVDKDLDKIRIFEEPQEGDMYIMGVDVSPGNSDDFSSFVIINTTTGDLAVEFKGKIRPDILAEYIERYGNLYSALTIIDTTGGYGELLIYKLQELDYKYLYYNKKQNNLKKYQKVTEDKHKLVAGYKIGADRPKIIGKFKQYVENNYFRIKSERLLSELDTFVYINGRPDHMSGFHDDIIFAAALAIWILETEYRNLEKAKKQTESILKILANDGKKSERKVEKSYASPFFALGSNGTVKKSGNRDTIDPNDYSWVLG